MNQAVSMNQLGGNALATGYKAPEFLYSCSAIILVNPGNDSAGLYHFPAGNIYDDVGSRIVIGAMIASVQPTEAHVAFGTYTGIYQHPPPTTPSNPEQTADLCEWLHGQLQFAPNRIAATKGSAAVCINGGHTQIVYLNGQNVTDLHGYAAGNYPAGFRVYWKWKGIDMRAPKPARRHSFSGFPGAL